MNLLKGWTYGAEHELSDWDCNFLPMGYGRAPDYTIVNSNGIAAQPDPRLYRYGGEINTQPTDTIKGQVEALEKFLVRVRNASVNYRSNLHIHIRVPGLKDDLEHLKKVQWCVHKELKPFINHLQPIPKGKTLAEKKREQRMYVSHHTFLSDVVVREQMTAKTVKEFFENEVPKVATQDSKRILWHLQPRVCVNLRQLLDTDTIEFRHFFGTLDLHELRVCLQWCHDFLMRALRGQSIKDIVPEYEGFFPKCLPFNEELEIGYRATNTHDNSSATARKNIDLILKGTFHGSQAYCTAKKVARDLQG